MVERRISRDRMEAWMEERRFGASVRRRIRRCNPRLFGEGEVPRGLAGRHHQRTVRSCRFLIDVCTRRDFERRWGEHSYRLLRPHDFVGMGGKRRAVSRRAYESGTTSHATP